MTTMKYRFRVDEVTDIMTVYDQVKVYRATTAFPHTWAEITTLSPLTRIPLVASVTEYLFDDDSGDEDYWYCHAFYNAVGPLESDKSTPIQIPIAGYVTLDDMRDEGFTATDATDAQVRRGIVIANRTIEAITNQWFEPRAHTFLIDGRGVSKMFLDVPIIAITAIEVDGATVDFDFSSVKIYNRHLTQGLTNPDDRQNPMISYDESYWMNVFGISQKTTYLAGSFYEGLQNIKLTGYFGYTELIKGSEIGETGTNSQVPLNYGDTPELIKLAARRLTYKNMFPLAKQAKGYGTDLSMMGNVRSRRNRDQAITFGGTDTSSSSLTGDPVVDEILMSFMGPLRMEVV